MILSSHLILRSRYLDRLPSEYDHLQTKFKPIVPKQPRPRLLPRHISENLPKSPAGARTAGFDYEQVKQMIFDCMNAMIEKHVLTVQVCRSSIFQRFLLVTLCLRTFLSFTSVSQWAKMT
jgi:hypothetical protein